mgnify:CR=1 FL=1|tara:strand:- start:13079 stop:13393 length:315 start_codon:yes stop_codon:yes gene_type:complete
MTIGRSEDKGNTVANILKQKENREKNKTILEEHQKQYKKYLSRYAASEEGKFVIGVLIKASGALSADDSNDAAALIRNSERKNFYFNFIRPYIEPEIRKELEND